MNADSVPWAGQRFESQVLGAFRLAVKAYCADAVSGNGRGQLRVSITVVTRAELEEVLGPIRSFAQHTFRRDLPRAELTGVYFGIEPAMADPYHRFEFDPAVPGDTTDAWAAAAQSTRREVPEAVSGPGATLVLRYGGKMEFVFPLYPSDSWLPLGRGIPAALNRSVLRIGSQVIAIPNGALLEVRYRSGVLHVRRAAYRPEYLVRVDGAELRPRSQVRIRGTGTIDYSRRDTPRSVLVYELRGA